MKRLKLAQITLLAIATAVAAGTSRRACAQELLGDSINGYLGFGYAMANHANNFVEGGATGSRNQFGLEFGRLSANVGLQLNYGTGLGYSSFGGRFLYLRPIQIPNPESGFLLLPGINVMAVYSTDAVDRGSGALSKFTDFSAGPHLRAMYDFQFGLAVSLDVFYDLVVTRSWSTGTPKTDSKPLNRRLVFGINLMVDSRFIE